MGKKYFVISEVVPVDPTNLSDGFKFPSDDNWVDSTHVIDGDRLRYGYPEAGIIYWNWDHQEWTECKIAFGERCLILDPPKAEEKKYPCDKCGKLRSEADGGKIFSYCDSCWDNRHKSRSEVDEWLRWRSSKPLRRDGLAIGTNEYYAWLETKMEWLSQMPRKP